MLVYNTIYTVYYVHIENKMPPKLRKRNVIYGNEYSNKKINIGSICSGYMSKENVRGVLLLLLLKCSVSSCYFFFFEFCIRFF